MKNLIEYRGYRAKFGVDIKENIIYGQVINIDRDVISFHADTIEAAKAEFIETVNEYLAECVTDDVFPDLALSSDH